MSVSVGAMSRLMIVHVTSPPLGTVTTPAAVISAPSQTQTLGS